MKNYILLIINIILLIFSLNAQNNQVKCAGKARNVMMGIDLSANISLDTLKRENLFALAPLNRLEGEITVFNGTPYTSKVDKKGNILMQENWKVTAPFCVYVNVSEWKKYDFTASISDISQIDSLIADFAQKAGYDTEIPFPFRLEGEFENIAFHIINKPKREKKHSHELHDKAKVHYTLTKEKGVLLGFFSKHHEGVFTHRNQFTHIHFLNESRTKMGHLEGINSSKGALTLYLPLIH